MLCINCNKETSNPKFCSRSCAATYNNTHGERKLKCKFCGKPRTYRSRFCSKECKHKSMGHGDRGIIINISKEKLESIRKTRHGAYSSIIGNARDVYKRSGKPKICSVCGYDKHVEICHIKPVSSYNVETILEINDISNLIALCPNHHWEFDKGILDIREIV